MKNWHLSVTNHMCVMFPRSKFHNCPIFISGDLYTHLSLKKDGGQPSDDHFKKTYSNYSIMAWWRWFNIGSDNALAPNRRRVINFQAETKWLPCIYIYIYICASVNYVIIGSDHCLPLVCRQAFIWTNAGQFLIEPLETRFSDIRIKIRRFPCKEIHF